MPESVELLKPRKRSRFTVDLPASLASAMDELTAEHDVSQRILLRDAIRLLVEFNKLNKEGYQLGGWKEENGTRETVRIIIGL